MEMEHYEEAAQKFERATRLDSMYSLAYINWGECLLEKGKMGRELDKCREAIEKFRRAVILTPNNPESLSQKLSGVTRKKWFACRSGLPLSI